MSPTLKHVPPRALGYVRVSTEGQHESGAGLAAQESAIRAEAGRRGWDLELISEGHGVSGASADRPALAAALARLDAGEADVLVVAKLDRLSRSVAHGAEVMDRAKRRGWSLVALDFGLDTTTPAGEMVAAIVLATSQYERRLIGQRTREALAAKRAAGVRLGRPQALPDDVVARIVAERGEGRTLTAIGAGLEADGVPTARGGAAWHASTVRAVLGSQAAKRLG